MTMTERDNMLTSIIFKTRIEPCRWNVCAEVGHFCRKGFRSPAATCDQMRFHFKIMSPEITAPLFVLPRCIPLLLRLAANWKILSGRMDLQKSPKRSLPQLLLLTRASPAPQRRRVAASPLRTMMYCARNILSNRSRGILPRRFFRIVPNPKAVLSSSKEGGRSKTARLRFWPPERRSGCTSAEPYPPSGSRVFWPCDGF